MSIMDKKVECHHIYFLFIIHSSIHSFNKYLLSADSMMGITPGTWDSSNKPDRTISALSWRVPSFLLKESGLTTFA
jgi:hypothetical protein